MTQFFATMPEGMGMALQILVTGWGGIFIVMLVIYVISLALARLFPPSKEA